mgnify:CR=1 FL=1
MKQKVYKKESRVSTQIRESGLFPCGFLKLAFHINKQSCKRIYLNLHFNAAITN